MTFGADDVRVTEMPNRSPRSGTKVSNTQVRKFVRFDESASHDIVIVTELTFGWLVIWHLALCYRK